jgi:small subunit ribosomal protein S8e
MYHGKITVARKKRKYNIGGKPAETTIGAEKKKTMPTKGGGSKLKLITSDHVNVNVAGKYLVCKIVDLIKNPANKDFTRRRVITKGAVLKVKTPEGKEIEVKVSSRPGQDGVINAVSI